MEDVVNATPWRGRRVMVTGHTGFKGAWLTAWLRAVGAEVTGLALEPATTPDLFSLLDLADSVEHVVADVRDRAAVGRAIARARPEMIFHLAAQAFVRTAYAQPLETFATNVMGTANVLDAARGVDVAAILVVTTDKCYEQSAVRRPFREDDPLGGHDPYSASKAAAEIVTASYRRSFYEHDALVASARAGNVVGGGDWSPDRLVPDIVRAVVSGKPLRIRYPDATRPWQHVTDALKGYLLVAERALAGDRSVARAWNFGPLDDERIPVRAVVERLSAALGVNVPVGVDAPAHHEAAALELDSGDAQRLLHWQPRHRGRDAIDAAGAWYRAFLDGVPAGELVEAELRACVAA